MFISAQAYGTRQQQPNVPVVINLDHLKYIEEHDDDSVILYIGDGWKPIRVADSIRIWSTRLVEG